jgi:LCP family protein required for cell wall assembly
MHDMDNKVWDKLKVIINSYKYDDQIKLCNDLINNDIDSIIINGAYLYFMEEYNEDFVNDVRVIYTLKIKKSVEKEEVVSKNDSIFTIYISGIDTYGNISRVSRSDVNILMTVNSNTGKVLLTTIPRDYYVQLHGTKGNKDKLTHAGIYGIDKTKTTIEDIFDIKIDYTIKVGFQSVIQIVDLIGGIDIESDSAFKSHCGDGGAVRTDVVKGMNHFNGAQALSYARERYAYKTGDNHRVQNQQQVLEAIIEKIFQDRSLLKKYDQILESFNDLYRTDIPEDYIKLIVKQQLGDMSSWKIERQYVVGNGAMLETYSMPGWTLWVMIPDEDSMNNAKAKINEVYNAE